MPLYFLRDNSWLNCPEIIKTFSGKVPTIVIPAKAGIQDLAENHWIPGQARNDGMGYC
jgi:hypothetical protein